MTHRFSQSFFLLLFIFSVQLLAMPLPTEAGLVPCGRTPNPANVGGDPDLSTTHNEAVPCTVCHLVVGGQGLIQWGLKVMTFIAVAVIVAMAILYIVSAGNEGLMSTAKSGITASLVGFAIMLGAWLIVSIVITTLADTSSGKPLAGLIQNGAFRFTCDTQSNAGTSSGVRVDPGTVGVVPTTTTGTPSSRGAVCENVDAAKQRLASGGTVCDGKGSCPSCNTTAFESIILKYASQHNIPPAFIRGMIARESSCNPKAQKVEVAGKGVSCGLMMVNVPGSSKFTCDQLKDPETGIQEGTRILAKAFQDAKGLKSRYGNTVTVEQLAAAIHNAGPGQSATSADCTPASGWPTIPKWGCPINPGSAQFNACAIRDYACNVGQCR